MSYFAWTLVLTATKFEKSDLTARFFQRKNLEAHGERDGGQFEDPRERQRQFFSGGAGKHGFIIRCKLKVASRFESRARLIHFDDQTK